MGFYAQQNKPSAIPLDSMQNKSKHIVYVFIGCYANTAKPTLFHGIVCKTQQKTNAISLDSIKNLVCICVYMYINIYVSMNICIK